MFVASPFTTDPRVYLEAKSLVEAGHKVTVIAWDREKQNPQRQSLDGIEIVRVRTWLSPRCGLGSPPWHALHLLLWQWQAYRQAIEMHKRSGFDIIHCHFLDTLFVGARLKQKLRLPLVHDARDPWGLLMQATFPHWFANVFFWLEKWLIKKADIVIAVSEITKEYFDGITDQPTCVVMNCKTLHSTEYKPPETGDRFSILYIGTLHKSRALLQLIHVSKELAGVQFVIGGIGEPGYVQAVKEECDKNSNITFLGRVPFDEVLPLTSKADVVFCMFDPTDCINKIGLPNKLFEAMVCGRPIICTKGTYSGELTEREEIGLAVYYTEEAIEQAIIKIRDNPELRERLGRNALRAAITKYNWQREEEKLLELYRDIKIASD